MYKAYIQPRKIKMEVLDEVKFASPSFPIQNLAHSDICRSYDWRKKRLKRR